MYLTDNTITEDIQILLTDYSPFEKLIRDSAFKKLVTDSYIDEVLQEERRKSAKAFEINNQKIQQFLARKGREFNRIFSIVSDDINMNL